MRVLVTGATGFLGRRIVHALLQREMEVRCLVHTPGKEDVLGDAKVDICYGDVTDVASLKAAMYQVDTVVHLAAIIQEDRGLTFEGVNVQGTRNIAAVSRERGVEHLVHVSVNGVRNNKSYRFLHSRWLAEQEVITSGLPFTIVRSAALFGNGDEFINTFCALLLVSPICAYPNLGGRTFRPLAVDDAAYCIAQTAGDDAVLEKIVELAGPEALTVKQVVDLICRARGLRRFKVPFPRGLIRRALQPIEAIRLSIPVTTHRLDALTFDHLTDANSVEDLFKIQAKRMADSVGYVNQMSFWDACEIILGIMPKHIRY
jgi:NADH dehydrogenase